MRWRFGRGRNPTELVAYFVAEHPSGSPVMELRSFMREKLPEYMIPGLFISLDVLPVTQNGKLDRIALQSLNECPSNLIAESPTARNEVEQLITQVWCDVLKIDPPGIHDNFFDLGGHSLLAVRVVARVEEAFQKQITLREFFDRPTISEVGDLVATTTLRKRTSKLPPILSVSRDRTFPLSVVQKQLWALDELFPGALFSIMPYVYRLTGRINLEALKSSLQAILNRHEAFRMIFSRSKGRPVQIVGSIPQLDLRIFDLQKMIFEEAEKDYERMSAEDAESPFDLEQGPPVRFSLVHFSETEHLLLVTVHHIVCDHWSMVVFRRELISLYDDFANRRPLTLFRIRVQLVDYVCWEKRLLKGRLFKRQVEYWKKIFESNAPMLKFKVSRNGVRSLGFGTDTQAIPTGETLLTDIRASGGRDDCTTFIVLVAIIAVMLFIHTDQSTIRIATTVANRRRPETESLIANCLNAVVLQLNLSWEMTFRELLKQARYRTLDALASRCTARTSGAYTRTAKGDQKRRTTVPSHVHLPESLF